MKIIRVDVDRNEKPVWQRKLKRDEWIKVFLDKVEPESEIGMESCGGAHRSFVQRYRIGWKMRRMD